MEYKTWLYFLVAAHVYLIIRYSVGNIVGYDQKTPAEKFKWLLIVTGLPFVGYFLYLKRYRSRKSL